MRPHNRCAPKNYQGLPTRLINIAQFQLTTPGFRHCLDNYHENRIFILIFLLHWVSSNGKKCYYHLEAERCTSPTLQYCIDVGDKAPCIQYREHASKSLTALLMPGDTLQFRINLESSKASECAFTIKDVSYSNDGETDLINFYLQKGMNNGSKLIGNFTTEAASKGGDLWDVFKTSGQVGTRELLISREYSLIIDVSSSDQFGVELDTILVFFACDDKCPEIPNHQQFEYSEKKETWEICLIVIGWIGLGMSLACNIFTCVRCTYKKFKKNDYVAIQNDEMQ